MHHAPVFLPRPRHRRHRRLLHPIRVLRRQPDPVWTPDSPNQSPAKIGYVARSRTAWIVASSAGSRCPARVAPTCSATQDTPFVLRWRYLASGCLATNSPHEPLVGGREVSPGAGPIAEGKPVGTPLGAGRAGPPTTRSIRPLDPRRTSALPSDQKASRGETPGLGTLSPADWLSDGLPETPEKAMLFGHCP